MLPVKLARFVNTFGAGVPQKIVLCVSSLRYFFLFGSRRPNSDIRASLAETET